MKPNEAGRKLCIDCIAFHQSFEGVREREREKEKLECFEALMPVR